MKFEGEMQIRPHQETAETPFRDGFAVTGDGLRLHYRDYPNASGKPPLLCLHGLTRNARDFARFAGRYSSSRRVIVPDFRGRGMSDYDPLPARYTPLTYAGDVLALLDQLMIDRAVFVGTSLGGLVTMTVAAIAPQRIAAAILNDIGPEMSAEGLERIGSYVGKGGTFSTWDEAADAVQRISGNAHPTYGRDDWLKAAERVCREDQGRVVLDYDPAIAYPFQTKGPAPRVDLWPLFRALGEKPLLVVRGELSDLLSAAALDKMHDQVPAMKSVTVPQVGHAPMLDEPGAVAAIDDFLASLQ